MNEGDIVKHGITAAGALVAMGIVLRIMWEVLRAADKKLSDALKDHCDADVETFQAIDNKLNEKQDKDMCLMEHKAVAKAFEDGREKFRAIVEQQVKTQHEVQELMTRFALIAQRLEIVMPKIEAAIDGRPGPR
jgi:hypothetical protein